MIVFDHTKFGLVWIKGSKVKRGGGFHPPSPRLSEFFEIPAWIGLMKALVDHMFTPYKKFSNLGFSCMYVSVHNTELQWIIG